MRWSAAFVLVVTASAQTVELPEAGVAGYRAVELGGTVHVVGRSETSVHASVPAGRSGRTR